MRAQQDMDRVFEEALRDNALPYVSASVVKPGGAIYTRMAGDLGEGQPAAEDALFYIASMTKAVTAVAFLQLLERGVVRLNEPVGNILPEFAAPDVLDGFAADGTALLRPATTAPTLGQIVTHTAGYSGGTWNPDIKRYQAEFGIPGAVSGIRKAFELPLAFDPGTRWEYGSGMDVIGQVIEAVMGMSLEDYVVAHIFDPLGMPDTRYSLSQQQLARMAPMFARQPDGSLAKMPFKAMAFPDFFPGGGGLASTIADFSRFVRMLLNDGTLHGATILKPETAALMFRDAIDGLGAPPPKSFDFAISHDVDLLCGQTGDWSVSFLVNRAPLPTGRQAGSLCWAGLRNTFFWADRASQVGGVMLCQTAPFMDPRVVETFIRFEEAAYALASACQSAERAA